MSPSLASVTRARYWTSCVLRIVAMLMIGWAMVQGIGAFIERLPFLNQNQFIYNAAFVLWPLRWLFAGVLVIAFENRLVRWLFPLPRSGCPQCNYPIVGGPIGTCPECGLALAPAQPPPGYPS